ncbi:hypothetical protein QNH26_04455 [Peribacillus frigoritolerans]|uniref:hypothetical protein n=1 Tax=Peribacillus frigoritolerans TaxID=450367 RepID=UPI0024C20035|nr:hypothetical protein [Peribacillus frigoritolerans]WHX67875.1 hypothetical protein QNH26_04455 [Peribacillus frigoritolerans]
MINYVSRIGLNKFVLFLLKGKRKAYQAYVASTIINRKAESNHCKSAAGTSKTFALMRLRRQSEGRERVSGIDWNEILRKNRRLDIPNQV